MTIGAIVETVETALKDKADRVEVDHGSNRVTLRAYVGKQLFTVSCCEEAKDDDIPAIS